MRQGRLRRGRLNPIAVMVTEAVALTEEPLKYKGAASG